MNARFLADNGGALQIRVPVIPKTHRQGGQFTADGGILRILGESVKLVQLLPYHKTGRMKYDRLGWRYKLINLEPRKNEFMHKALELFQGYGLNCQLN